jgi:hypothetical protein
VPPNFGWTDDDAPDILDELDSEEEAVAKSEAEAIEQEPQRDESGHDGAPQGDEEAQAADSDLKVEERLQVAQYYQQLLGSGGVFADDTAAARRVNAEVRKFVRSKLEYLMGLKQEPSEQPAASPAFSDEEVAALKALARTALKSRGSVAIQQPPAAPKPALRRVAPPGAPAPQRQEARPRPAPVKVAQAQARPPPKAPAADWRSSPRIPEQYRADETLSTKGGRFYIQLRDKDGIVQWIFSEDGKKRLRPAMKDITLPAAPGPTAQQPIPMPSLMQSNLIQEQQAGHLLNLAERKNQLLGGAVIHSMLGTQKQEEEEENRP